MDSITSPVDHIAGLFGSEGARNYLGEPVTVAAHLLQAAALAEAAGAPPSLVAAALLHDIGHLPLPSYAGEPAAGDDDRHGDRGAAWLSAWFPPDVTEPVRLHVDAKRYLCTVEPSYFGRLSQVSRYTLSVQGGPMNDAQAREFEALRYAPDAVAVRRWDEQAKDPLATPPGFAHFAAVLESLLPGRP